VADLLATLVAARAALLTIPQHPPVLLRGDEDRGGEELIMLDRVSDTAQVQYGSTPTSKRLQVTCYARTIARALELTTEARTAMSSAGFGFVSSRPAPDDTGEISEYRR
jgi:hypothetical protein